MTGKILGKALLAGVVSATLLLAGCGRKGPLDIPAAPAAEQTSVAESVDGVAVEPVAAPAPAKPKSFPLDFLIR